MAQLWGGRFTKQTDQLVFDFNASITFDKRLFHEDVTGSIVHATMLASRGSSPKRRGRVLSKD